MKNGHLPPYIGWMAYTYKMWMSVRYGIGKMTNNVEDSKNLLDKWDCETLNVLVFSSTIKKGWRKPLPNFGGVRIFDFNTEHLIERLNLLLQHYRSGSAIGKKLDHSLSPLQLQIGTNIFPLDLDYGEWGKFAPISWIKMLRKTLHVSGFGVHLK